MKLYLLIILIIFLLAGILLGFNETFLIVRELESGDIIWNSKVYDGSKFIIRYTHSVHLTPVLEYFKVDGCKLILYGTDYQSYGAGLPFSEDDLPGEYLLEEGFLKVRDINKVIGLIPLRVGNYAKHKLVFNSKEYHLYEKVKGVVEIKVSSFSFFDRLRLGVDLL
ncbi:DUF1850 domain-containing protein [Halonatronum saccharophilum]|uniref:DUF1850 domain-containing protein n=1 Tax=Halonatronum saccharophilum TaxID=150060 RepID=UPI0004B7C5E7|nr:DUF1850 domain-containing protein [Halonatronum saccharophilum]